MYVKGKYLNLFANANANIFHLKISNENTLGMYFHLRFKMHLNANEFAFDPLNSGTFTEFSKMHVEHCSWLRNDTTFVKMY